MSEDLPKFNNETTKQQQSNPKQNKRERETEKMSKDLPKFNNETNVEQRGKKRNTHKLARNENQE